MASCTLEPQRRRKAHPLSQCPQTHKVSDSWPSPPPHHDVAAGPRMGQSRSQRWCGWCEWRCGGAAGRDGKAGAPGWVQRAWRAAGSKQAQALGRGLRAHAHLRRSQGLPHAAGGLVTRCPREVTRMEGAHTLKESCRMLAQGHSHRGPPHCFPATSLCSHGHPLPCSTPSTQRRNKRGPGVKKHIQINKQCQGRGQGRRG